ncbi:retinal dehydrogenase 2-like [Neocloeon triangulifer]|uniref:retinal dehydrogenase 2-like n=1 Tax=Neocloeon triangulifer TaxID=2078957 RepID=UPI00286EB8A2|nr:retinal dehydrogenase 2-like [Neocloeon triangulifer]
MAIRKPAIKYTKLFINNQFVDSISGKTFRTINPATGEVLGSVSEAGQADIDAAVNAAKNAFKFDAPWRTMLPKERGNLMYKLASLIERDHQYIASLETVDNGQPYSGIFNDMQFVIDVFRYYAGWCDKIRGSTIPVGGDDGAFAYTRKEPIGVVGCIIPWNFPMLMLSWKLGPALAAGCTVVLKPSELTPLTALYFGSLVVEAGFPPGVVNIVPGYGPTAGEPIAYHPDVNKIAFTGSTQVGKLVARAAAESNLKRVSLELGGKSCLVVYDTPDLAKAAEIAQFASFFNQGQNCTAGSKIFVHEEIYDEFLAKAKELTAARKTGDPFDEATMHGPQIDQKQLTKVLDLIQSGVDEGATLEVGGKGEFKEGFFVNPTLFSNVNQDMKIAQEEIFGPVQMVFKFSTLEEVIEQVNNTKYGLASGIITSKMDRALAYVNRVNAGSLWINCYDNVMPQVPFGGFKQSGFGRELGEESLKEYLEVKSVICRPVPT